MIRQSPTYKKIQDWVRKEHGFVPKTCWIAHCKEIHRLPLGSAPNRQGVSRAVLCPPAKISSITEAFRHFKMIP